MGPLLTNTKEQNNVTSDLIIKPYTNIMLVGDSVLDNFIWLKNNKNDLKQQLENMITTKDSLVFNFAVDESETKDILSGKIPGHQYQYGRKEHGLEGYPVDKDGIVYPVKLTEKIINQYPERDNILVLSIGGNDGRICLPLLMDKKNSYETVSKQMIQAGFKTNFLKIIEKFTSFPNLKIIVVLVYKPYQLMIPGRQNDMHKLYDFFREFYTEVCKKNKLPMIDLSVTFDYNDPSHYGEGNGISPIEPSNKSSQFIADLISTVIDDFQWGKEEAKMYTGIGKNIKSVKIWEKEMGKECLEKHRYKECINDLKNCIFV